VRFEKKTPFYHVEKDALAHNNAGVVVLNQEFVDKEGLAAGLLKEFSSGYTEDCQLHRNCVCLCDILFTIRVAG
jgi:hypothetical protein